jgi:hypothetical protein
VVGHRVRGFVVDAFSRRIVGWKASRTMTTSLVLDALDTAARVRRGIDVEGADLSLGCRRRQLGAIDRLPSGPDPRPLLRDEPSPSDAIAVVRGGAEVVDIVDKPAGPVGHVAPDDRMAVPRFAA